MVVPYYMVYQGAILIVIKYEFIVLLPSGIAAQVAAANSQPLHEVFSDINDCLCNVIVSSELTLY